MKKMHTQKKRKLSLASHFNHRELPKGPNGARTFKTEEAATAWAKEKDMKNFTIVPAKKDKKFKIVVA